MRVPPLRDYAEDVPELLRYYVDGSSRARLPFRRFSVAAQNRLRNYPWPDNVRELRNLMRRMLIAAAAKRSGSKRSNGNCRLRLRPTSRW